MWVCCASMSWMWVCGSRCLNNSHNLCSCAFTTLIVFEFITFMGPSNCVSVGKVVGWEQFNNSIRGFMKILEIPEAFGINHIHVFCEDVAQNLWYSIWICDLIVLLWAPCAERSWRPGVSSSPSLVKEPLVSSWICFMNTL